MTRRILCKQLRAARKIKPFGTAPAAGTEPIGTEPTGTGPPIGTEPTGGPVKQEVKQVEEKPLETAPAAGTEPIGTEPTGGPVKQEVKQVEEKPLETVPQREPVKNQDVGRVYNQEEAANFLGVSAPTLRKYMRLGRIKFKKECNRVFFTQQHLNEFLQGGK